MDKFNITTSGSGQNRDGLNRDQTYVALITKEFCKNEYCLGELRDAHAMKLPMFALVKSGFKVPIWIQKMPWIKVLIFTDDKQISVLGALLKYYISQLPLEPNNYG